MPKHQSFTHQDSLRGSITPERAWWDLTYYHLDISVHPEDSTLNGKNTVQYKVLESHQIMQIDLQHPMEITQVMQGNIEVKFTRNGNVYYLQITKFY